MAEPALTLYHTAPSRSSIALWMLEETGEPYKIELIRMSKEEQRKPEYLAVNPMGKVPALIHNGMLVTEAAAICAYLADAFPAKALAPASGSLQRGAYYRWLFFGPGCYEPAMIDKMANRPAADRRMMGYGDFETTLDVLEAQLKPGPYVLGTPFSAADVVLGSGLRFGMQQKAIPERPVFTAYVGRLSERPAFKRAFARDMELMNA